MFGELKKNVEYSSVIKNKKIKKLNKKSKFIQYGRHLILYI